MKNTEKKNRIELLKRFKSSKEILLETTTDKIMIKEIKKLSNQDANGVLVNYINDYFVNCGRCPFYSYFNTKNNTKENSFLNDHKNEMFEVDFIDLMLITKYIAYEIIGIKMCIDLYNDFSDYRYSNSNVYSIMD